VIVVGVDLVGDGNFSIITLCATMFGFIGFVGGADWFAENVKCDSKM
jgi:hypothetical protein